MRRSMRGELKAGIDIFPLPLFYPGLIIVRESGIEIERGFQSIFSEYGAETDIIDIPIIIAKRQSLAFPIWEHAVYFLPCHNHILQHRRVIPLLPVIKMISYAHIVIP